jgi:hypothetical protein
MFKFFFDFYFDLFFDCEFDDIDFSDDLDQFGFIRKNDD